MSSKTTWMSVKSAGVSLPVPQRHVWFLGLVAASVVWFWGPLSTVVSLSLEVGARDYGPYEHYSHIILVPFVTVFLVWMKRRVLFEDVAWDYWRGGLLLAVGLALSGGVSTAGHSLGALSATLLACVVTWWGAFVLCYGTQVFRKAVFGLLLLVFMVPLPPVVLNAVIGFLQHASAETADVLFGLLGVPVFRDGIIFVLPNIAVRVAEECSGIRSSLVLFITGLVAGHVFLRTMWAKAALVSIIVPVTIFKNAVRIVGLSLLANYVDPSSVRDSVIHRNGGIPIFFVTMLVLAAIVRGLKRIEHRLG